jgi:hypothetical protein
MSWTAIFQNAVQRDGHLYYSIVYTDGTQKVMREYVSDVLDDAAVQSAARSEIARFDSATVSKGKLTLQPGATIDLTVPITVPPVPTAAELAQAAFLDDYAQWRHYQNAIKLGVMLATDKRVADVQAKIIAEWLDA